MSALKIDENARQRPLERSFAGTPLFKRTFDESMALIDEVKRYLDGRGEDDAQRLSGPAAALYESESLRVTTRLMQAASWLLVQRAVHEGDMSPEDAAGERYRLGSKEICFGGGDAQHLPKRLQDLLNRSESLYRRIARLETVLFSAIPQSGVRAQRDRLERIFGERNAPRPDQLLT